MLTLLYPYLIIFAVALVVTMMATPLARKIAIRFDAIDYPSARRINTKPIPRMGGIAILCGLVAAVVVQYVGTLTLDWPSAFIPHPSLDLSYWGIAFSVLVIFMTGVIDDIHSLKPWQKFLGQIIAGVIAAASGLVINVINNTFGSGDLSIGWVGYPITVIYLVAFANIINLIDGLDGLAAGIATIVCLAMFTTSLLAGRTDAAALSIALAGACVGFLRYNFHPASIFMGDSGSLTIGFVLGIISLLSVRRFAAVTTLILPLIIAGVPIMDTAAAIVRRMRGHVPIGHADRGHIQHRLIKQGFGQRETCLLIYAWSAILALGAVLITLIPIGWRFVVFFVLLATSALFVTRLHLFDPVLRHYYDPKTHEDEILPVDDPCFAQGEKGGADAEGTGDDAAGDSAAGDDSAGDSAAEDDTAQDHKGSHA